MILKNERCIVTGAAGFIGSHLSKKLLDSNVSLLCIDNMNDYYDKGLKQSRRQFIDDLSKNNYYKFIEMDLREKQSFVKIVNDFNPSTICHLAAQAGVRHSINNPQLYVDNNITSTLNVLEAARINNVKDVVFASTSSVYGLTKEVPFNEEMDTGTPISAYSASKKSCELLCHTYHHLFGIRFRILRFFTVYGPWGRPDMALTIFTKSIINKEPVKLYNEGEMSRDFTYIDDLISGILSSISNKFDFEIFNLGSGKPIPLKEYIFSIEKALRRKSEKTLLPMQQGDVHRTWADISKAQNMLSYNPSMNLDEGVTKFVNWYKDYYKFKD